MQFRKLYVLPQKTRVKRRFSLFFCPTLLVVNAAHAQLLLPVDSMACACFKRSVELATKLFSETVNH